MVEYRPRKVLIARVGAANVAISSPSIEERLKRLPWMRGITESIVDEAIRSIEKVNVIWTPTHEWSIEQKRDFFRKKIQCAIQNSTFERFLEHNQTVTCSENNSNLMLFSESTNYGVSCKLESKVYSILENRMLACYLKPLLVRLDRSILVTEQISGCDAATQASARDIRHNLQEEFGATAGLSSVLFAEYKTCMSKLSSTYQNLSVELHTYPCNVPHPSTKYNFRDFFTPIKRNTKDECANVSTKLKNHVLRAGEKGVGWYRVGTLDPSDVLYSPRFNDLTFVEKTVVLWRIFVRRFRKDVVKFSQRACRFHSILSNKLISSFLTFQDTCALKKAMWSRCCKMADILLFKCLEVKGLSGDVEADSSLRANHFPKIVNLFNARFKEMIGIFTLCVKHYSQEDEWKRSYVLRTLAENCKHLSLFWTTSISGSYMAGDINSLLSSFRQPDKNFTISDLDHHFLKTFNYELGREKKDAIYNLLHDIENDADLVARCKCLEKMSMFVLPEPKGCTSYLQVSSQEHQCESCKSWKTFFVTQLQICAADEPMTVFLRCADCRQIFKIGGKS